MSEGLRGKVALVTGGGLGIGEACAHTLAAAGARVVVADIDAERADRVATAIRDSGLDAHPVHADVADEASVAEMVDTTMSRFGRLDAAVNNAGVAGTPAVTGDYELDAWRRVMNVNLDGVFLCLRAEVRAMRANGGGAIVNMASIMSMVAYATQAAYVASKHGVLGLTRAAALDHAADGIRINAVGPGFIMTPMSESSLDQETLDALAAQHALGRCGTPQEVAELTAWLLSDAASFATGGYYPVDGGYLVR